MIFIYSISFILLVIATKISDNYSETHDFIKFCVVPCTNDTCIDIVNETRGNNYFIDKLDEETSSYSKNIKKCLITSYGVSHFILYFILGYFVPSLFLEEFMIGILFEFMEQEHLDCEDLLDIILNLLGLILGKCISPY